MLPGERIAWCGQAGGGIIFTGRDLFLIPFSIFWCGFALTMFIVTGTSNAPREFPLVGGLFVLVGLYLVFGRFVVDWWVRRGLSYAVTDRRILIAGKAPFRKFIAIGLAQLADVNLFERASGRGTIRFGPDHGLRQNAFGGMSSPSLESTPQFIAIDEVRRVFDLVQRLSAEAASRANA